MCTYTSALPASFQCVIETGSMISYRMIVLRNLSRPGLRYWSQYLPLLNIFGDVSIVPLESLYESLPVFPTKAPSNFSPFPSTSPEYLHRRYGGVGVPFRLWQGVSEGLPQYSKTAFPPPNFENQNFFFSRAPSPPNLMFFALFTTTAA